MLTYLILHIFNFIIFAFITLFFSVFLEFAKIYASKMYIFAFIEKIIKIICFIGFLWFVMFMLVYIVVNNLDGYDLSRDNIIYEVWPSWIHVWMSMLIPGIPFIVILGKNILFNWIYAPESVLCDPDYYKKEGVKIFNKIELTKFDKVVVFKIVSFINSIRVFLGDIIIGGNFWKSYQVSLILLSIILLFAFVFDINGVL